MNETHETPITSPPGALQGKTILVIEDDNFISRVYSKWLAHAGAHVETAFNGALGLEVLKERRVDLILLDLGMPGMNGYDTLSAIRENPGSRDVPVIILSNTTVKEKGTEIEKLRKAGVKDILRKYDTSLGEIVKCIHSYFPV